MPTPSTKLTARQGEILTLISKAIERTGYPPTRAEIAAELGFRSANAAEDHLHALARKGMIELSPGTSRGIRLTSTARQTVRPATCRPHARALPGMEQLLLPLIGRVAAGSPILAQEHIEQTIGVEARMFASRPDYLLKVKGMSMQEAGILDGDLLAVKQTQDVRNGQIVVARLGDEVTVKRLQRQPGHIELLPENPDFAPILVRADQVFAIEGLAVGLIRSRF
ncbi:MAG: transcriptional repressor LexA [Betaproteobacteria bacterium]|nr:transcriptional repressor LexA [Betaproteobacteria bacterium]MDE2123701.1 transcriptional repressor LexA [Betaproteobacteria bacterium]MDE2187643.1 transcriptional repressor LexA [Betaproteobacteria bacterium]MDE2324170.1 transcriptional repressor LexA [Betaproteobacteria bacterium]